MYQHWLPRHRAESTQCVCPESRASCRPRPRQNRSLQISWMHLFPPGTAGPKEEKLGCRSVDEDAAAASEHVFLHSKERKMGFRPECAGRETRRSLSLSFQRALTLLNKEKGYIFPWIKSNTEKTVTAKTIEFISTDIA